MAIPEKIGRIRIIHENTPSATDPQSFTILYGAWNKNGKELNYTKYQIKETDHRIKTATFSSPDYIDLTTGRYFILISSKYHENFAGVILDVDYDPETGVYNYQCQDWSRVYMVNVELKRDGKLQNLYNILVSLLTQLEIEGAYKTLPASYPYSVRKFWGPVLSGLKSIAEYDQSLYEGNKYTGNPMKKKPTIIVRNKPIIEVIRDLVFGSLGFFDVWFNDRAVLQIEPISKSDWEKTGLHLTTEAAMKQKYKFSTTNAITRTYISGSGTSMGKGYNLNDIKSGALDLTMFFGWVSTSISDPTQKTTTTSAASTTSNSTKTNTTKTTTTTTTNKDNPYGTKNKEVWLNSDRIYGNTTDVNFMKNVAKHLEKAGWKTHVYGRAYSEAHYQHRPGCALAGQVKNGIWFTIYGGVCAGTLRETANTSYFRKPLIDRGSRTVVGFLRPPAGDIRKGGKYYSYLPRAHDDGFSGGDPYIRNCAQYLTDHAIPFCYGKDAKQLAEEFLAGGYNKEACTKDWKFYNKGGFLSGGR
jgi:hypothetical protein